MHDPFPIPPPSFLITLFTPIANKASLQTLPLHIHEVLLAALSYHCVCYFVSPRLSRYLFPATYPKLNPRTRLNWDVHVVSFFQSVTVCSLALWIMAVDMDRKNEDWRERVWGYTGAGGLVQGFAAGYFLWDLWICARNVGVFGWGMLAHAVAALVVFSLGFRPFIHFYGPTFILYELSSPFLNIHWFLDKLHMTGTRTQWYNGLLLLSSFFLARLVWGTYQSVRVYQDVWAALHSPMSDTISDISNTTSSIKHGNTDIVEGVETVGKELMQFMGDGTVPVWLAVTYLGSNIVLNSLNFYWFGKMIETVRKRFKPDEGEGKADGEVDGKLGLKHREEKETIRIFEERKTVMEFRRRKV